MLAFIIEEYRPVLTREINQILAGNHKVEDKHLVQALWLKLPLPQINKLIEQGASISSSVLVGKSLDYFDQYPLTVAIQTKLPLDYIKVLDNDSIPVVYKFWLIQEFNPADEIVLYLLNNICNFLEDDTYLTQWREHRYHAPFFLEAKKKENSIHGIEPEWNSSPIHQAISRGIRLHSYEDSIISNLTVVKEET